MAKYQIFGYLAIWQGVPNIAKWGIPEKSIKNAAQKRWPQVRRTFHSKVMDENGFWNIFPLYILWARKKCRQTVIFQDKNLKIEIWAIPIGWHLMLTRFLSTRKKCFFGSPYSVTWTKFIDHMAALVPNLANIWHHLHYFGNCPPDGATCISSKFCYRMVPLA